MSGDANWEHASDLIDIEVRNYMKKLHTIWDLVGMRDNLRAVRYNQVKGHIAELLAEMVEEAEHYKAKITKHVQDLLIEETMLSKELGGERSADDIGYVYEDYPLTEVEIILQRKVQDLRNMKEKRINYLQELLIRERNICTALGVQPMGIATDLPNENDLRSFELYLEKQEVEKNHRENSCKDMRQSIIKMMDELHITPSLDFQKMVCNNFKSFVFTDNNVAELRNLQEQLKQQVKEAKQQAEAKKEELIALWKYLEEPAHNCEAFLQSHPGYNVTTLNALRDEIKRCKKKRTENIAKYVGKVRCELKELWDRCHFSEAQRRKFLPMSSQTFTEDLLTLHELEVASLQKFYEDNSTIFELFTERQQLWEKMKELEERANDPDRFHNRGGQLLAEEKERKKIQKKLPKIEEEIIKLSETYEEKHGTSFTINGVAISEYMKQSWKAFDEAKQTMKTARKQARDRSESSRRTPLSVSKRTPGTTSMRGRTPVSTKRKLPAEPTPTIPSAKRPHVTSSGKSRPSVSASKIKKGSSRVSRRIFNHSGNKTSSMDSQKRSLRTNSQNSENSMSSESYRDFQEHLQQREELRSSVLPEKLLENTKKSHMRTPVKTPVKPLRKNLAMITPNRSTTPKLSQTSRGTPRKTPHSPRMQNKPRLATAPSNLPFIF